MTRSGRRFATALAATGFVALAVAAAAADGGISGPCSASLAGANVAARGTGATAKPIVVGHDASLPIVMSAAGRLTHVRISLEFAGISWVVEDRTVTTPVYVDTIPVKDYATYGVGLYKVSGTGTGPGLSCSGSALVRVKGNPLTSIAGIGGVVVTALGATGMLLGAIGPGGAVSPFRVARGSLAGLVAALGVLVLLQETALLYPTLAVAIAALVLGAAAGGGVAFLPSLRHAAPTGTGFTGRPATPAI
jgi:hypothetical protein